jgi:hypothetical protein
MGMHGEYLLSLTEDFDHELIGQPPFFELNLVDAQKTDDAPAEVLDFSTYRQEENVFQSSEEPGLAPTVGDRKLFQSFGGVSKLRWPPLRMTCTNMFPRSSKTSSPDLV